MDHDAVFEELTKGFVVVVLESKDYSDNEPALTLRGFCVRDEAQAFAQQACEELLAPEFVAVVRATDIQVYNVAAINVLARERWAADNEPKRLAMAEEHDRRKLRELIARYGIPEGDET